jgi:hypothetical protein
MASLLTVPTTVIILLFFFQIDSTSPIGIGHMINHPANPEKPELKPNVMVIPYEFSRQQGKLYSQLIPNSYVSPEKFMFKLANNHVLPNSFVRVFDWILS